MKKRDGEFTSRFLEWAPRLCRLAGILNRSSEGSLSFRFRYTHKGRAQQRLQWFATDA